MNRAILYVAISAAVMTIGGCNRNDQKPSAEPKKDTIAPAPVRPGDSQSPTVPGPGADNPKK